MSFAIHLSHQFIQPSQLENHDFEPHSEAVKYQCWRDAMTSEIIDIQDINNWEITTLSRNKKDISCKWILRIKYNYDGYINRYRACLVAMAIAHKKEFTTYEPFPVAKMTTLCFLLIILATNK